jgi:hypothetical protein
VGAVLFYAGGQASGRAGERADGAGGQTDEHEEANCRFSHFN